MENKLKYTWIIGASTGIGAELAKVLAKKGETLCLSARGEDDLKDVQSALDGKGHIILPFDASDRDAMKSAVEKMATDWLRIDRIIFMAGIYTPSSIEKIELDDAEKIISVNLMSVFYLINNVLPVMKAQKGGQIAICGSVAGYIGLPNSQPYGASKAALINLVESLRAEEGGVLDIKLISPGFVKTRLTDKNDFDMPARISAEEAGEIIAKGLDSNKFEIHFPKRFTYAVKFIGKLPYWVYFKLAPKML